MSSIVFIYFNGYSNRSVRGSRRRIFYFFFKNKSAEDSQFFVLDSWRLYIQICRIGVQHVVQVPYQHHFAVTAVGAVCWCDVHSFYTSCELMFTFCFTYLVFIHRYTCRIEIINLHVRGKGILSSGWVCSPHFLFTDFIRGESVHPLLASVPCKTRWVWWINFAQNK